MKYEKWSPGYSIFRIYVKLAHRLVYKNITVTGLENIPGNKPVIFAPNHQNAANRHFQLTRPDLSIDPPSGHSNKYPKFL